MAKAKAKKPKRPELTKSELRVIDAAVERFAENLRLFDGLAVGLRDDLLADKELKPYIHFIKWRVKTPEDLRGKLKRKALEAKAKGLKPSINAQNVFRKVTDIAGVRI